MKDIDADYYGYRDEDDGVIAPLEQEVEKKGMNHSKDIPPQMKILNMVIAIHSKFEGCKPYNAIYCGKFLM